MTSLWAVISLIPNKWTFRYVIAWYVHSYASVTDL